LYVRIARYAPGFLFAGFRGLFFVRRLLSCSFPRVLSAATVRLADYFFFFLAAFLAFFFVAMAISLES
jgi:hypothetical protein